MSALGNERDTEPPPETESAALTRGEYVIQYAPIATDEVVRAHEERGELAATAVAAAHLEGAWDAASREMIDLRTAVIGLRTIVDRLDSEVTMLRQSLEQHQQRIAELEGELEAQGGRPATT